jgi:hypothetical protein
MLTYWYAFSNLFRFEVAECLAEGSNDAVNVDVKGKEQLTIGLK